MWHNIIEKFHEENKNTVINLQLETHIGKYLKYIFEAKYVFTLTKSKSKNPKDLLIIKEKESGEKISEEKLFFWYQNDLFNEILTEEKEYFLLFNEKKNKIIKAINDLKESEDKDKDNKITKLDNHLNSEADTINRNINELKRFRLLMPTFKSFEIFLSGVMIILKV